MAKNEWISAEEAANIVSQNSGHDVSADYIRLRSNQGRIRARAKNGREKEYFRPDCEGYTVRGHGKNRQPKPAEEVLV